MKYVGSELLCEGGQQAGSGQRARGLNFMFEIGSRSGGIGKSALASFFLPITKMILKSKAEMLPSSNPS